MPKGNRFSVLSRCFKERYEKRIREKIPDWPAEVMLKRNCMFAKINLITYLKIELIISSKRINVFSNIVKILKALIPTEITWHL